MKNTDKSTGAIKSIEYGHHELHDGKMYQVMYSVASIGALTTTDNTQQISWTTPMGPSQMHMTVNAYCGASALFLFTEAPTGGDATASGTLVSYNKYRARPNHSVVFSYDGTEVSGGTVLETEYISAGKFGAGETRSAQEWILRTNTKYAVSLLLDAAEPATLALEYYMHTDRH
jgi:hypothetical protein